MENAARYLSEQKDSPGAIPLLILEENICYELKMVDICNPLGRLALTMGS